MKRNFNSVKVFIAVLSFVFVFVFLPLTASAAISYNVSAVLAWGEPLSDYDLYVRTPLPYLFYYNRTASDIWAGDRTCADRDPYQEALNAPNRTDEGIWYFWYNKWAAATEACPDVPVTKTVTITANTAIMINDELVQAGQSRDFQIPLCTHYNYVGGTSGGITHYLSEGLALNIQAPAVCTEDADCPADQISCTASNVLSRTTYSCVAGQCQENAQQITNCGNADAGVDPEKFACDGNKIKKLWEKDTCDSTKYDAETNDFSEVCGTRKYWKDYTDCPGKIQPALQGGCVLAGVRNQFQYQYCSPATVDVGGTNPITQQPIGPGECAVRLGWETTSCATGCVFDTTLPNSRCGSSPVQGNEGIERKLICTQCLTSNGQATCLTNPMWQPALDCGSPQTVVKEFCSNNLQCTITVNYPGQCFYWPPNTANVGGCRSPSVAVQCNGPCAGVQDNVIANQCNANRQCVINGGGAACANNADCGAQLNQCNINKQCVPGGGGLACINDAACQGLANQCNANRQCVPGGGGLACNANADCQNILSCNANNQCVAGGGGLACVNNAACVGLANQCNVNNQCVPGGGGVACNIANGNADCAATSCNGNKQCVANGGGLACNKNADCQFLQTSCNANRQCVAGGGGANCNIANGNDDCLVLFSKCNELKKCVPGGTGGVCAVDGDCDVQLLQCNANRQCVAGGGGANCANDAACLNLATKCNADNQCVPGGDGIACLNDATCEAQPSQCNASNQCVPGGGGAACDDDGDCGGNLPPYAESLQAASSDYCSEIASFTWVYRDSELCADTSQDTEKMYRIQVSTNSAFDADGLVVDKIVQTTPTEPYCGQVNTQTFSVSSDSLFPTSACKPSCPNLNYGVPYYWRVMVWENITSKHSDWINYSDPDNSDDNDANPNTFTFIWGHPAPIVVYSPLSYDLIRTFPAPSEPVYFADSSTCFDADGRSYSCKCHASEKRSETNCLTTSNGGVLDVDLNDCTGGQCYTWNFDESNIDPATLYTIGDVTHTYGIINPLGFLSTLQVCDDIGCCTASQNIPVKNKNAQDLPQWKEISPF